MGFLLRGLAKIRPKISKVRAEPKPPVFREFGSDGRSNGPFHGRFMGGLPQTSSAALRHANRRRRAGHQAARQKTSHSNRLGRQSAAAALA